MISGFFFTVLVRCTPFNSERLDLLVCCSQFCTLATLWFALMSKIGFFAEEGVSEGMMETILMLIMFFPVFLAVYIVGLAIYEAVDRASCCSKPKRTLTSTWGRLRGMKKKRVPDEVATEAIKETQTQHT